MAPRQTKKWSNSPRGPNFYLSVKNRLLVVMELISSLDLTSGGSSIKLLKYKVD